MSALERPSCHKQSDVDAGIHVWNSAEFVLLNFSNWNKGPNIYTFDNDPCR